MGDTNKNAPEPTGAPRSPTAEDLRERQAIAAALMIGEEMRREDRRQVYWYTKRIGLFVGGFSIFFLLILFAMSRMRPDYNPMVWMLVIAALGAGGLAAAYWAYAEDRRHRNR